MTLKERAFELVVNAEENGYPIWDWAAKDIVDDILAYSDELHGEDYDDVVAIIVEIKKEREA